MRKFKRDKDTKLQLKCTKCGGQGKILGDIHAKTVQCTKCDSVWDGVAQDTESTVYNQMRKKQ